VKNGKKGAGEPKRRLSFSTSSKKQGVKRRKDPVQVGTPGGEKLTYQGPTSNLQELWVRGSKKKKTKEDLKREYILKRALVRKPENRSKQP